jgi:hypothetical protein
MKKWPMRISVCVVAARPGSFMYLILMPADASPTNVDSMACSGREVMRTRKLDGSLERALGRYVCKQFFPATSPLSSKASITMRIGPTTRSSLSGSG